jgi:hypothetical protein
MQIALNFLPRNVILMAFFRIFIGEILSMRFALSKLQNALTSIDSLIQSE